MEDEIAGVCSAIGASYAGHLAVTSTSGPGLALKSEAIGLAVMAELPLVVIDVQRGGPSTGLPTKTEQTDLYAGPLRPQRRVADMRAFRRITDRLLPYGFRGRTHRNRTHDSRNPPHRRVHSQRLVGTACA